MACRATVLDAQGVAVLLDKGADVNAEDIEVI